MTKLEYLLIQLTSECCEVGHRATKALHFGLYEIQPGQGRTNKERLVEELIDLMATIEMLESQKDGIYIDHYNREPLYEKQRKIEKYMTYSKKLGICK